MSQVDYRTLVEDLDTERFTDCVNLLYDSLQYNVLTKEEIRPVDLLEKLAIYQKDNMTIYAEGVMELLDNTFTHNYATTKFYEKAKKEAGMLIKDCKDVDIAEDLAKIFICFVRCYCVPMEQNKPDLFHFEIRNDDYKSLRILVEQSFYKKDKRKDVLGKKVGKKPNLISDETVKFVYIVSILFWCRLNQFEGIVTSEEE